MVIEETPEKLILNERKPLINKYGKLTPIYPCEKEVNIFIIIVSVIVEINVLYQKTVFYVAIVKVAVVYVLNY